MLKNIPSILPPDLLKILAEMGHTDELVIGDSNFPSTSFCQRAVHCEGTDGPQMLDAILSLMPLDDFEDAQVQLMRPVPGTVPDGEPPVWKTYREIIARHEPDAKIELIERGAFYERSKKAYCIVQTGETSLYACLILKKGVIRAQ